MNPGLLLVGGLFFLVGLFRRLAHDIDLGENLASPSEWRQDPEEAARKHRQRSRLLGYLLMGCGALLFGLGLLPL